MTYLEECEKKAEKWVFNKIKKVKGIPLHKLYLLAELYNVSFCASVVYKVVWRLVGDGKICFDKKLRLIAR